MTFIPLDMGEFKPTPWQIEDLMLLTDEGLPGTCNFSEMGCYKTSTGLWWLDKRTELLRRNADNPCVSLIITTKSGKGTYFDAIPKIKELEGFKVYNVDSNAVEEVVLGQFRTKIKEPLAVFEGLKRRIIKEPTILITHYNAFENRSKMLPLFKSIDYSTIIVDEAHRMKNRNTQWTRNLKQLKTVAGYKHAMTGTGFINRPDEIWSILNFIYPDTFTSYWKFRKYFCDEYESGGYTIINGIKPEKLQEFINLRKSVSVRRRMKDVHKNIKEPIFVPREVELNPTQRKMYDQIKNELRTLDKNGVPLHAPNVLAALNRLRQVCVATPVVTEDYFDPKEDRRIIKVRLEEPSTKLDELDDILNDLQWDDEERQQIVVFSNFKDPLELLKKRLDDRTKALAEIGIDSSEWSYLHMQEKHNEEERYKMWHDIWPQKKHRIFMSTLQLGSESINLSSAEHMVFLDRSWSPKDNNQGVARCYRPGQEGTVQVIHINAKRTTDQRIERRNDIKMGWFNQFFNDEDDEV